MNVIYTQSPRLFVMNEVTSVIAILDSYPAFVLVGFNDSERERDLCVDLGLLIGTVTLMVPSLR